MELILWRHAEAEPGEPDNTRALTARGRKQAMKMAGWLDCHLPPGCKIWCSPASRTVQTAESLGRKFKIHDDLGIASSPDRILKLVNWPHAREPALVIGHQPLLGQLASLLLTGTPSTWTLRKSGIWWLAQRDREDSPGVYVKAVMTPALCGKPGSIKA
jgi:phosphohistidine phosphatase